MLTRRLFPQFRSLYLLDVAIDGDTLRMAVAAKRATARCPLCGRRSNRVHSRYQRTVADLPVSRRTVVLVVQVRRFRCRTPSCPRRIFAESLPGLVSPYARKSQGLAQALEQIGFASGGRGGARLARQLGMPVSPDTLLRLTRAASRSLPDAPTVIGIDDWAHKRGLRCGTIICDLERHRVLDLLPERSAESTRVWLQAHPTITVIARDRSGLYADAATRGAPQAVQVVDRWHLVDNLAEALEKFLLHKGSQLKDAAVALVAEAGEPGEQQGPLDAMYQGKRRTPRPRLWEQRQLAEREQRVALRRATYAQVLDPHAKGGTPMAIARTVGVTRTTVYRYLRAGPPQPKRPTRHGQQRVLAPWEPYLLKRWGEGCQTATRLWREIRAMGFAHSITCVQRFCNLLRLEGPPPGKLGRARSPFTSIRGPSARRVASVILQRPERRTAEQTAYLAHLCQADVAIATADKLAQGFLLMVRQRQGERLHAWMEATTPAEIAELRRFALGLHSDYDAIQAGLTLPTSNGQTEGFINKLKLTKRSMYGRGRTDLLRQRLLHAA